ncbi:MAG: hypothetical protein HQL88_09680 [Magnetococcales bacterium]|nr:hypothetical protein [Magnetococcales bacterium]
MQKPEKEERAYDCVVGYYLNPLSSGVAKFNHILADLWGVPVVQLFAPELRQYAAPLLSIKLNDMPGHALTRLHELLNRGVGSAGRYALFLHATTDLPLEQRLLAGASAIFCGDAHMFARLSPFSHKCQLVWAPATLQSRGDFVQGTIRLFTFGMAHKIKAERYVRLKELLDQTRQSYAIYLSTAIHESDRMIDSFTESHRELDELFEGRVNFMGYLSDQALVHYLKQSTFFASFFDQGVRSNNTSVMSAMQCGAVVITNLDAYSPPEFVHGENLIDIQQCTQLPLDAERLQNICHNARRCSSETFGWQALERRLRGMT